MSVSVVLKPVWEGQPIVTEVESRFLLKGLRGRAEIETGFEAEPKTRLSW